MHIQPLEVDVYPATIEILTETFGPFFEVYARPHLGERVFQHQHGHWEQDYREEAPTLHAPEAGRNAAVATQTDDTIASLISWRVDAKARHGEIYLLAVSPRHRLRHVDTSARRHVGTSATTLRARHGPDALRRGRSRPDRYRW